MQVLSLARQHGIARGWGHGLLPQGASACLAPSNTGTPHTASRPRHKIMPSPGSAVLQCCHPGTLDGVWAAACCERVLLPQGWGLHAVTLLTLQPKAWSDWLRPYIRACHLPAARVHPRLHAPAFLIPTAHQASSNAVRRPRLGSACSQNTNPLHTRLNEMQCAGHASAVLQNRWYILGGGNNARGCTDMVSLDLAPLVSSSSAAEPQVRAA